MIREQVKPKLVFFQYRYDENLPEFLLIHTRDHVRCLSEFFDVTVIHDDGDYQEICDKYEPDLALFESGVNHTTCHRPKITNTRAYPSVPKVGLHNADAFCNARTGFLSDMDHLGIETFFAICTTAAEHTPEIADNLFSWPNCINPDTYRDYGEWKSIPVLFSGNTNVLYPWRQKIVKLVSERYPSLICPHAGYDPGAAALAHVLFGERYARMINASMMAPACGTVAKEVVRKHFEIPACNSCLVTERSAPLEAAGFIDMENCVFADERDVLDKLRHLFQNPAELQRITERGHQLVHTRHTYKQRDQIFQWYSLHRNLQSHQAIVQSNPFGSLSVVDKSSGSKSAHVRGEGLHLGLLRRGDDMLRAGKYSEAESVYLKCMSYMRWMPEPKLGVALSRLCRGDAKTAHSWIVEQIQFILAGYGALDPDPVEWAYYVLSLLCLGQREEADRAARQFGWLHHPELDRIRSVISLVSRGEWAALPPSGTEHRRTIHRLPATDWTEWLDHVCLMLRACGQQGFAEQLKRSPERPRCQEDIAGLNDLQTRRQGSFNGGRTNLPVADAGAQDVPLLFKRRFRTRAAASTLKRLVGRGLHRVELTCGYFLPYRLSAMRKDEFLSELQALGKEQRVESVIRLGVGRTAGSTEALLAGISETDGKPNVFCIDAVTRQFRRFEKTFSGRVHCHGVQPSSSEEFSRNVKRIFTEIKKEHHIDVWDAVVIDGFVLDGEENWLSGELQLDMSRARLVVFDGMNNMCVHENHDRLLGDPNYALVAHNPGLRQGYAIFKRMTSAVRGAESTQARRHSHDEVCVL